ncbi:MAG TPA: hypothetical protein VFP69_12545, partial [Streptomyces sp.]|nr:hypothetical protein [Streptomyces sp.]
RRDLARLIAADELDLARQDAVFRARWGPGLLDLFRSLRPLLGEAVWHDCETVLTARYRRPA